MNGAKKWVVLPARKREFTDSGTALLENLSWNACLDEIAKLGPLYTHAEVERLRAHLAELKEAFNESQEEIVKHRKMLAERDALLRTVLNAFEGAEGHPWMPGHVAAQIKPMVTAALSAIVEVKV